MKVEQFATGILGTNTYLVINEQTKRAVVIDPAALPKRLKNYIAEMTEKGNLVHEVDRLIAIPDTADSH